MSSATLVLNAGSSRITREEVVNPPMLAMS